MNHNATSKIGSDILNALRGAASTGRSETERSEAAPTTQQASSQITSPDNAAIDALMAQTRQGINRKRMEGRAGIAVAIGKPLTEPGMSTTNLIDPSAPVHGLGGMAQQRDNGELIAR